MGRLVAWVVVGIVGLVVAGMLAVALLKAMIGALFYLVVGALVIGGGYLLYAKVRRELGPGTRTRNRLDAAAHTYRADRH